jgi:hypothetical protein
VSQCSVQIYSFLLGLKSFDLLLKVIEPGSRLLLQILNLPGEFSLRRIERRFSFQALFLFDSAGRLDRIRLAFPESMRPTAGHFKAIENSLSRKYREPFRSSDGSRVSSAWILSQSAIEIRYLPDDHCQV